MTICKTDAEIGIFQLTTLWHSSVTILLVPSRQLCLLAKNVPVICSSHIKCLALNIIIYPKPVVCCVTAIEPRCYCLFHCQTMYSKNKRRRHVVFGNSSCLVLRRNYTNYMNRSKKLKAIRYNYKTHFLATWLLVDTAQLRSPNLQTNIRNYELTWYWH